MPLANFINDDSAFEISGFKVYSGLLGIRGSLPKKMPGQSDDDMPKKIIPAIKKLIETDANKIIPIDIKFLLEENGISDGECRLNNVVSFELPDNLKKLQWPSVTEKSIVRQFYLVVK